jgi:transmembrane sensor
LRDLPRRRGSRRAACYCAAAFGRSASGLLRSRIGSASAIDLAAVTAWQQGLVIFRSTPITDVIAEVNRYRPGRVILTNAALGRRQLNARFRIEDIDQVVGQIEQVFGARATTLPGGIVLLG